MMPKTYVPKKDEIQRAWWIVDAEGLTLGRVATEVASRLRGKHKPSYTVAAKLVKRYPERLLESAVRGMLPKGPLGRQMARKLKVYAGDKHPHAAQQPRSLELKDAARAR